MNSYYATVEVDGVARGTYVEADSMEQAFIEAETKTRKIDRKAVTVVVKAVESLA